MEQQYNGIAGCKNELKFCFESKVWVKICSKSADLWASIHPPQYGNEEKENMVRKVSFLPIK